jgi:hypothetical protein
MSRPQSHLTQEENAFLGRARKKFEQNAEWLEFEDFAFGARSPLYSKTRSHKDVLTHPLYVALKDMWLELGVRQGRVKDASGRKARGGR